MANPTYNYRGTVKYLTDLSSIENPNPGDVFKVEYLQDGNTDIEYGIKYYYTSSNNWEILRTNIRNKKTVKFKKKINGFLYDLDVDTYADSIIFKDDYEEPDNVSNVIKKLKQEITELKTRLTAVENKNN